MSQVCSPDAAASSSGSKTLEGHGVSAGPSKSQLQPSPECDSAASSSDKNKRERRSVSAEPRQRHRGSSAAQALMTAINLMEDIIVDMHGHNFFHRDSRKDYIMTLPTAQAWEVFDSFKEAAALSAPLPSGSDTTGPGDDGAAETPSPSLMCPSASEE